MSTWRIDPGVARDLADVLGWDAGDGPVALTRALGARLPTGSTAKAEAVAAGRTPPGADPEAIARRVIADRAAGRPEVAWSCWAATTLMSALLETRAGLPTAVAGLRRIDDTAPPVDVHSLVVVDGLLCDPYFASVVAGPGTDEVERVLGGVWCRRTDEPDGRWTLEVGNGRWGRALDYRLLAPVLDRGDVAALCAVSVTFTGANPLPFAFLKAGDHDDEVLTHTDGGATTRRWAWDPDDIWTGTTDEAAHSDWATATAAFAATTGIRLV